MAKDLTELTRLFGLLSDATRLQIVLLLAKGESNVTALCEALKLAQPTVSHHLGLLRMNRVAVAKRAGKQVIYSLAPQIKASGGKLKISVPPCTITLEGA